MWVAHQLIWNLLVMNVCKKKFWMFFFVFFCSCIYFLKVFPHRDDAFWWCCVVECCVIERCCVSKNHNQINKSKQHEGSDSKSLEEALNDFLFPYVVFFHFIVMIVIHIIIIIVSFTISSLSSFIHSFHHYHRSFVNQSFIMLSLIHHNLFIILCDLSIIIHRRHHSYRHHHLFVDWITNYNENEWMDDGKKNKNRRMRVW